MKYFLKYILLFIVACVGAIAIYYAVVPEDKQIPIGIKVTEETTND